MPPFGITGTVAEKATSLDGLVMHRIVLETERRASSQMEHMVYSLDQMKSEPFVSKMYTHITEEMNTNH